MNSGRGGARERLGGCGVGVRGRLGWVRTGLSCFGPKIIVQSRFGPKILFRCMNFESLKVELGFPSMGDPLIPPGRGC
jgi:hypothetical protein